MNQNGQDKKRLELWEQYEDAYIQMLVYEVAKMEGEELLEKNERLKNDPNFQVPESITEKCLETIRREVAKREKQKRKACVRRIAIRVACVAAILGAMAVTAYAAFPALRAATLNLLIQTSEVSTRLVLGEQNEEANRKDSNAERSNVVKTVFDYVIPDMPQGFYLKDEWEGENSAWISFRNAEASWIKLYFYRNIDNALEVDTEGAEVHEIQIHDNDGLLCIKDTSIRVVWNDKTSGYFLTVWGDGVQKDTVIKLAEDLIFTTDN